MLQRSFRSSNPFIKASIGRVSSSNSALSQRQYLPMSVEGRLHTVYLNPCVQNVLGGMRYRVSAQFDLWICAKVGLDKCTWEGHRTPSRSCSGAHCRGYDPHPHSEMMQGELGRGGTRHACEDRRPGTQCLENVVHSRSPEVATCAPHVRHSRLKDCCLLRREGRADLHIPRG